MRTIRFILLLVLPTVCLSASAESRFGLRGGLSLVNNDISMISTESVQDQAEKLFITDTTFRDGQQSRTPYTADQIVQIYKLLHKLGGKKGIIRQSEFFVYSEKDREALRRCMDLGYDFPECTTWIRD